MDVTPEMCRHILSFSQDPELSEDSKRRKFRKAEFSGRYNHIDLTMTEENIFLFVPNLIGKFPGFVSRAGSDLMRFCFPSAAREASASLSREEGARWKRVKLTRVSRSPAAL